MHIILHIGPHKTGTTSVQKTLGSARAELASKGISFYEDKFFNKNNHYVFHHAFSPCLSSHFHTPWFKNLRSLSQGEMRREIKKAISDSTGDVVVVSSEDLSILPKEGLSSLRKFLSEECGATEITIVGVARDPFDYLQSSIQQYIKPGLTSVDDIIDNSYMNYTYQSCPDFQGGAANILRQIYLPAFSRFVAEFGRENCIFGRFDEVAKSGLANFVISQAQVSEKIELKELRSNTSISAEACVLIAVYNSENVRYAGGESVGPRNKDLIDVIKSIGGRKAEFPIKMTEDEFCAVNSDIDDINKMVEFCLIDKLNSERVFGGSEDIFHFSRAGLSNINKLIENLLADRSGDDALAVRYRDAGIKLYESDPEIAYLLLKRAAEIRPNGKLIERLLSGLKEVQ